MSPIIDVHTHLGQFNTAAMSVDGERLCRQLDVAGIAHAVTFSIGLATDQSTFATVPLFRELRSIAS